MLSKKDQTRKNCRLRDKPSMKNKPRSTAEERDYLDWLHQQETQCFQCGTFNNIEWHHVKEYSTDKKNHNELIPLCKYHHTGHTLSPHGTPRQWRNMYPIEVQRAEAIMHHTVYSKSKV